MATSENDKPGILTILRQKAQAAESGETGKEIKIEHDEEAIGGRYRLGKSLGVGGMGRVQEAWDNRLERSVAVKFLKEKDDAAHRAAFFWEATLLSKLEHPGTLPCYDVGEDEDWGPYFVMKKIEGSTLWDMMLDRDKVEDEQTRYAQTLDLVRIVEKVCETVAFAHSKGFIHRDLKPENVMVDEFGVVHVMDWGLAKPLYNDDRPDVAKTSQGSLRGTPMYMAPEQVRADSETIGATTDVFAIGTLLYEVLTCQAPFEAKDIGQIFKRIETESPPAPHHIEPRIAKQLSAICLKAIEKDQDGRYQSVKALATDLANYFASLPVSAYRSNFLERLYAWAGANIRLAAIGLTLLIVGVGLLTALSMRWELKRQSTNLQLAELQNNSMVMTHLNSRIERAKINVKSGKSRAQLELAELKALRYLLSRAFRVSVNQLIGKDDVRYKSLLDDKAKVFMRQMNLDEVKSLFDDEHYLRAHFLVTALLDFSEVAKHLEWQPEEIKTLIRLRTRAYRQLKTKHPDFAKSDWRARLDEVRKISRRTFGEG